VDADRPCRDETASSDFRKFIHAAPIMQGNPLVVQYQ
jgi:hypothetical protein